MNRHIYLFFRFLFRLFFRMVNRLEVVNAERVPAEGGLMVAANHLSYLDPPVIGAALRRRPTYLAKEELFRVPLIRGFIRHFSFPVRRGRPRPSTIKETIRRLNEGELVVIFPEGGLSVDGPGLDAKRGIGLIAAAARVSVVPVLVEGTERALPVGSRMIRPARIRITFGEPVSVKPGEALNKDRQMEFTREIMEAIEGLRCQMRNKKPGQSGEAQSFESDGLISVDTPFPGGPLWKP